MHERLTFYIHRQSPLHSLNPLTKIVLTFTLIMLAFFSPWYWTAPVLILFVILPLSILGRVQREYVATAGRLLLPVVGFIFVMQSLFLARGGRPCCSEFWFLQVTTAESYQRRS
jgi:energy-coupling factor transporter transmembrane protein EcfT